MSFVCALARNWTSIDSLGVSRSIRWTTRAYKPWDIEKLDFTRYTIVDTSLADNPAKTHRKSNRSKGRIIIQYTWTIIGVDTAQWCHLGRTGQWAPEDYCYWYSLYGHLRGKEKPCGKRRAKEKKSGLSPCFSSTRSEFLKFCIFTFSAKKTKPTVEQKH